MEWVCGVRVMVVNATFNNISVISGLPVNGCFPDAAVVYVVSVQWNDRIMNISKLNYASLHDRNDINFPAVLNKIIFTSSLLMEELPCGQKKKFEYPLFRTFLFSFCYIPLELLLDTRNFNTSNFKKKSITSWIVLRLKHDYRNFLTRPLF